MTLAGLATEWSIDGPLGLALALATVVVAVLYLVAATVGARRDRRGRRWPRRRTACFLGGLAVLLIDLYSGIGTDADSRLSAHMVEHMIIWLVVAPLLVGGAPVRLAFFSLRPKGRRTLARALHSRRLALLVSPSGSVAAFSVVLVVSHVPAVYDLTLENDLVHVTEHVLYLVTAILVWTPLVGIDPLPNRPGQRARMGCMLACMVPMIAISIWLLLAASPVYSPYAAAIGSSAALRDQRLAALIMLAASLPAFAVIALTRAAAVDARRQVTGHASA
jgi:putative membrane protein